MLVVERTNQFKKDYKLAKRRGKNLAALDLLIKKIVTEEVLESRYRDHALTGQ